MGKKEGKRMKKRIDSPTIWWAQSHRVPTDAQLPNLAGLDLPPEADRQIEMHDIFEIDLTSTKKDIM
jgi:hypothetical protein